MIVINSCRWGQEKIGYGDIKPEIFKFHNSKLKIEEIEDLIVSGELFGICKIDISLPKEKRSKWEERNFPPIIAKRTLTEDDICEEMRHLLQQKKAKFPLGNIGILQLTIKNFLSSSTNELLE